VKSGKSSITALGFDDNHNVIGIPREDQIHTAIFGEVGSGKSTFDTIMKNRNKISLFYKSGPKNSTRMVP
jgi:polynucleotide 5'-kinase involved in rRNA processing